MATLEDLEPYLHPDEEILWSSPAPKQFLWIRPALFTFAIGLGFSGIAIFFGILIFIFKNPAESFIEVAFMISLTIICLLVGLATTLHPFYEWISRRRSFYTITNLRSLILIQGQSVDLKSYEHHDITELRIIKHQFHSRSISLYTEDSDEIKYPELLCINDVEQVHSLILKCQTHPRPDFRPIPHPAPDERAINTGGKPPSIARILDSDEKILWHQPVYHRWPLSRLSVFFILFLCYWTLTIVFIASMIVVGMSEPDSNGMPDFGLVFFLIIFSAVELLLIYGILCDIMYRKYGHVFITSKKIMKTHPSQLWMADKINHDELDEINLCHAHSPYGKLLITRISQRNSDNKVTHTFSGISNHHEAYQILLEQKSKHAGKAQTPPMERLF